MITRRKRFLLEFATFHFLPIAASASLLGLYCGQVYWRISPDVNTLNALQFAAKVHESLIVASLSSIFLEIIRHRLLAPGGGLRLGLLAAPFQMGSPMYLVSHEFRASVTRFGKLSVQKVLTIAMVLYFFTLTAITGPSTAIAMIPKLAWWPVGMVDNQTSTWWTALGPNVAFGVPFSDLYPNQLGGPLAGLNSTEITGAGLQKILDGFWTTFASTHTGNTMEANITTLSSTTLVPRTLYVHCGISGDYGYYSNTIGTSYGVADGAYATTPTDAVNYGTMMAFSILAADSSLFRYQQMQLHALAADAGSQTQRWKQPSVLAYCAMQISAEHPSTFWFPYGGTGYNGSLVVNTTTSTTSSGVTFIDPSTLRFDHQVPISAAVALWPSPVFYEMANGTISNANATSLCLLSAQWSEADVYLALFGASTSSYSPTVSFDMSQIPVTVLQDTTEASIAVQSDWLASLEVTNATTASTSDLRPDGYFDKVRDMCYAGNSLEGGGTVKIQEFTNCASIAIALGVADALSHVPDAFMPGGKLDTDDAATTTLIFELWQYAYAYGFRGATIYLAFVVLFLHILTVTVHTLVVLFKYRWTSKAWSSLGQLIVLALNSPPSELLEHTSAGVKISGTWRLETSVRELAEGDRIGIVVGNKAQLSPVQANASYS